MFFKKKLDRVLNVEEAEKRFEEQMEGQELERKDKIAMVLAALIVFVPALLLVIGAFLFVIWLFFLRFL